MVSVSHRVTPKGRGRGDKSIGLKTFPLYHRYGPTRNAFHTNAKWAVLPMVAPHTNNNNTDESFVDVITGVSYLLYQHTSSVLDGQKVILGVPVFYMSSFFFLLLHVLV